MNEKVQAGDRVELANCNDPHTKLTVGTRGTVRNVDSLGTVHVDWDDGGKLGLCADDGDRWRRVYALTEQIEMLRLYPQKLFVWRKDKNSPWRLTDWEGVPPLGETTDCSRIDVKLGRP